MRMQSDASWHDYDADKKQNSSDDNSTIMITDDNAEEIMNIFNSRA